MKYTLLQLVCVLVAALIPSAAAVAQFDDTFVQAPPSREDFFDPLDAPVRADKAYDVTIIYFFDYACPACRAHSRDVSRVFDSDRKLRVIYRDTPIFGPRSHDAARHAIASRYQGRHEAFHRALMAQKLPLDDAAIRAAADRAGVDWERLQADLGRHGTAIDRQIARNDLLSRTAGISGTPAFIIGNSLTDGALDEAALRVKIADTRASQPKDTLPRTADAKPEDAGAPEKSAPDEDRAAASPDEKTAADPEQQEATDQRANTDPTLAAPEGPESAEPMFEQSTPSPQQAEGTADRTIWYYAGGGLALAFLGIALVVRRRRRTSGS
ncbi:DsbA family protein [Sphingomicrobium marinum]|uniref:DsbA family protein n=1 Tax=Sphingomicrobium marinum TaxID=1227950 RepID=UPI002240A6AE|nr:DsbA family protein [Sphingomicrobium marinum]